MPRRAVRVASCAAVACATAFAVGTAGAAPQSDDKSAQPKPLNILLTNDDGWRGANGSDTPFIVTLRDALKAAGHNVVVVAAGTDQSGQGGRISQPPTKLELANPEPDVWTLTPGSPSDAVYFGLDEIFAGEKPDLVISGMNPGTNYGALINHSGTVNAALTALEFDVPSVAISLATDPRNWPEGINHSGGPAATYVTNLVKQLQDKSRRGQLIPEGVALNVNYPLVPGPVDPATGKPGSVLPPKGTKATSVAEGPFLTPDYIPVNGEGGRPGTYTIGLSANTEAAPGTDVRTVTDGYVSVSALEDDHDVDVSTSSWLRDLTRRLR
ncbi:MAG TPA: 5'/3'-nucleotidase SurE [Yinghuangia sp.]|uniref:5'/3'-nucleotidase SurE n=1 Tax=Yinghuangia sp. YIM S10712 TaxID=3436930 RepID=UPI002B8636E5|nr:5'/3'-nucleotidase SurE [Yinghuangia sp.]